jgi:hypothetical protein
VTPPARERVTIDLRGIGPRLQAHAAAHGRTTAAVVRAAVVTALDAESGSVEPGRVVEPIDARVVKVTLRLDGVHASWLARRARLADVSQGAYVMGLLDGQPPSPRSADHGVAVAALADSTHKVATMSADIHGFLRLIRNAKGDEAAEKYRAGLMSLAVDMRAHLEVASRLMLELTSQQRTRLRDGAQRREGVSR